MLDESSVTGGPTTFIDVPITPLITHKHTRHIVGTELKGYFGYCTNADLLSVGPLGADLSENSFNVSFLLSGKINFKMSPVKCCHSVLALMC